MRLSLFKMRPRHAGSMHGVGANHQIKIIMTQGARNSFNLFALDVGKMLMFTERQLPEKIKIGRVDWIAFPGQGEILEFADDHLKNP
jgi:hypothetical protein